MRITLICLGALLAAGCDQGWPTAPTREVPSWYTSGPGPTIFVDLTGAPPAPSLPATLPSIAGQSWVGTLSLLDTGELVKVNVPVAFVVQADRAISGNWRSNTNALSGSFTGTLTGVGADTRIAGTFTFVAPTASGASCTLRGTMAGPSWPSLIWWEIPTVTLQGCTGSIREVRLTLWR